MTPAQIKHITVEERLLFACMKQRFDDADARNVAQHGASAAVHWDRVYDIATEHGVAPMLAVNLRKCAAAGLVVPDEVMRRFKNWTFQSISEKEQRGRQLRDALAFFDEKSLDVMLIKGAALDLTVYEKPWYVTSSDIDLIFRCRMHDVAEEDLERIWDLDRTNDFECEFGDHHDLSINGTITLDYEQIWADAERIDCQGHPVFVMCTEDMLIAACLNSCRKRYYHLKMLYGLAEIVRTLENINWQRVADKAAHYDCQSIVYTALLVAMGTVGCDVPAAFMSSLRIRPLRAAIIRSLTKHMSYASMASRTAFLRHESAASMPRVLRKSNLSVLLPYASYRSYQIWRKVTHYRLVKAREKRGRLAVAAANGS